MTVLETNQDNLEDAVEESQDYSEMVMNQELDTPITVELDTTIDGEITELYYKMSDKTNTRFNDAANVGTAVSTGVSAVTTSVAAIKDPSLNTIGPVIASIG